VSPAPPTTGGVAGVSTSKSSGTPGSANAAHSGVLGAHASLASQTLPFTGMPLWPVVAAGAFLLLGGLLLRRAHQH
jgi:hypothetical protein